MRLLKRLFLAVLAPVLFMALAEGICRVTGLGYPTRFLIPFEQDGRRVWVDNQLFGYRFFSPAMARAPAPIVIPMDKAPDEYRVVLLGESAAMGEPEPGYGPARMLESMLQAGQPGKQIRVINAAMTAINSHVIREIARDLERMQPDSVILYIGNNEVVGPFGPGTVFTIAHGEQTLTRTRVLASRLRIASLARALWYRYRGSDQDTWRGMEMFTSRLVAADDPAMRPVYVAFADNLRAIIADIRTAGATPVLSTVAVNLADQAPFDGSASDLFPHGDRTDIAALKDARDGDRLRFRADNRINGIIRSLWSEHGDVFPVDAEARFEQDGPPGANYFLDHVHVNLSGSYLLAKAFHDALRRQLNLPPEPPDFADVTDWLVWNPYNALEIAEIMYERVAHAPFSGTADHAERMMSWARERASLHRQIRDVTMDAVIERFRTACAVRPDDPSLPALELRALLFENRFAEAADRLERLRKLLPHRADIRGWMTIIAALQGRPEDAWLLLTKDMPPLGEIPADMLVSASETLFSSGYRTESAALLETAARHYPRRLRLQALLASRLMQIGMAGRARKIFEDLVHAHPDERWLREEYGLLLAVLGNTAAAEPMFEHLRTSEAPDDLIKYARFLMFTGAREGAAARLESSLLDHPGHAETRRMLSQLYGAQGRLDEAAAMLETALAAEPWRGDDMARLAGLHDGQGRPARAVQLYQQAIPLLDQPMATMRAMAWLLATSEAAYVRNPARALALTEQIIAMDETALQDPATVLVHAAALAASDRFDEAADEVERSLRGSGTDIDPSLAGQLMRSLELYRAGESIRISRGPGQGP